MKEKIVKQNFLVEKTEGLEKEKAKSSYLETLNGDLDEVLMKRYVPVDIYLDTDNPKALEIVNESVKNVLDSIDMKICSEPEIFKGSIIEKFWTVTRTVASNIEVIKKVSGLIRTLKGNFEKKAKDQLFSKKEPAIQLSETLKLLKDVPNISIRIGSLLMTKSTSRDIPLVQVKNLTKEEMILIDRNPSILKNPRTIHTKLNTLKQEQFLNNRLAMNI